MSITFEGGPCRRGGHTTRYKTRGHCVECAKAASKKLQATRAAWYQKNREARKAHAQQWRADNPEKVQAHSHARYARKKQATGNITSVEQSEVLLSTLGLCAYCLKRTPLTLDHIEPLSHGGEHSTENATAVCKECNAAKRDKPLLIWLAQCARDRQLVC